MTLGHESDSIDSIKDISTMEHDEEMGLQNLKKSQLSERKIKYEIIEIDPFSQQNLDLFSLLRRRGIGDTGTGQTITDWNMLINFYNQIRNQNFFEGQIRYIIKILGRKPIFGKLRHQIDNGIKEWLDWSNIKLYIHQTESIDAILDGKNIIVVTSTASGKSLIYNIPVINSLINDPDSTFLYIFPRKALERDQYEKLAKLFDYLFLDRSLIGIYDGDTTPQEKVRIRRNARVIMTNPYGLHYYIPFFKQSWGKFIKNLKYVIIDEAHFYKGVFGSNFAMIMRRMRRLFKLFKVEPQYILTSATIGNPLELAEKLIGVKGFKLINKDGSGNPGRYLFFWSLPLYKDTDDYKSPHTQTRHIFNFMVERGVQTIAFTRSRKMAELNASYSKRMFKNNGKSHLATRIMSYRAGYLKEHRRLIEEGLKEKKFLGVYATNALELGVDIGTLECSILSGYPGTISSWWQQIGRAGRKHELDSSTPGRINFAGSFYVPLANPLDFYYLNHPEELLEKPHENCYIDLKNKYILANHLKCAAKEMVLIPQDLEMFGESMEDRLIELEEQGEVKKAGKNYYYSGKESFVPKSVKLTSRSDDSFQVVLKQKYNRKPVITSEDKNYAIKELHPGAIYYYMTEAYIVTEFDYDKMKIILEPFNGDYYTEAAVITSIRELGPPAKSKVVENNGKKLNVYYGDVMVEENVIGYRVKNIITDEIIDYKELDMPPLEMETKALWLTISNEDKNAIMEMKYNFAGSIHAVEHAAIGMAPYFTSCDRSDLGGVSVEIKDNTKANPAAIYIYDGFPGGIGLSELLYNKINELLEKTLIMISECPCKEKCPACVMSPKCGNNNEPLDKYGAIALLKLILGKPIQKKEIKNKKQK